MHDFHNDYQALKAHQHHIHQTAQRNKDRRLALQSMPESPLFTANMISVSVVLISIIAMAFYFTLS